MLKPPEAWILALFCATSLALPIMQERMNGSDGKSPDGFVRWLAERPSPRMRSLSRHQTIAGRSGHAGRSIVGVHASKLRAVSDLQTSVRNTGAFFVPHALHACPYHCGRVDGSGQDVRCLAADVDRVTC